MALQALTNIPISHSGDFNIILTKLNLASGLGYTYYQSVLSNEMKSHPLPYVKYLYYSFYGDSVNLNLTLDSLALRMNNKTYIDSVKYGFYEWN
jgi:hypothetical protein